MLYTTIWWAWLYFGEDHKFANNAGTVYPIG